MKIETKQFAILCDAGKRTHNEDFVYPTNGEHTEIISVQDLYIVCDGIGGANKGDVAARLAASNFATYFSKFPPVLPIAQPYLDGALKFVEGAMDDYIKQHPECWGMGTTIALLYLDNHGANIAWAGNSRVYHFRGNQRKFRTEDHTEVNQLIKEGKITEQEAQTHNRRHSILRAIQGGEYPTQLDVIHIPWGEIQAGDYFFLCTDGLLEAAKDDELATLFGTGENADKLNLELQHLCQIGSNDNYGSIIVQLMGDADKVAAVSTVTAGETNYDSEVETRHLETPVEEGVTENVVPLEVVGDNLMAEIPADFLSDAPIVDANAEVSETPAVLETPNVVAEVSENVEEVSEELTEKVGNLEISAPVIETANIEAPVIEAPVLETPVITPPVVEVPKIETPKIETPKVENPFTKTTTTTNSTVSNSGTNPQIAGNDLPEPSSTSNSWLTSGLITLGTMVILLCAWFWWSNSSSASGTSYDSYMVQAKKLYDSGNYEEATAKAQEAFNLASNDDEKKEVNDLSANIRTARMQKEIETAKAEAASYEKDGKYIDLFKAKTLYLDIVAKNADADSSAAKNVSRLSERMKGMNHEVAFGELMEEAKKLCGTNGEQAALYIEEAATLDAAAGRAKEILALRNNCNTSQESRDIASGGTENNGGTTSNPEKGETKPTRNPAPRPNLIKGGVNSSKEVVASRDIPTTNARVGKTEVSVPASNSLSEGKRLYEKGKAQKSAYVYKQAVVQLEKAARGKPASAEAAYLLSVIYNEGLTGSKDAKKAVDFAKQSADMNYPQGAKYYGTMLQKLGDTKNAAIYLNKAKAAGVK
jgi:protein phosphatase